MGVVDDPVEDGVGDGGFADHVVPLGDGQLGGDQGGFASVALFKDFQKIEALLVVEVWVPQSSRISNWTRASLSTRRGKRPSRRAMARSSNRRGIRK